jgi:hypothetical protein
MKALMTTVHRDAASSSDCCCCVDRSVTIILYTVETRSIGTAVQRSVVTAIEQ